MDDRPQAYPPPPSPSTGGVTFVDSAPRQMQLPRLVMMAERLASSAQRVDAMSDTLEQLLVMLTGPRPSTAGAERDPNEEKHGAMSLLERELAQVEVANERLEHLVGELRGTLGA